MNRERARKAVIWLAVITQLGGGVLGFVLAPDAVFADINADALAKLCLRLAAWSNASMAVLTLAVLWSATPHLLRWAAVAGVVYHLPAGLEAGIALSGEAVRISEPAVGPLVFHSVMAGILLLAAVAPIQAKP